MNIGRNQPCPCGSGKKYKKCCLKSGPDPISYTRERLNRFHEQLIGELFQYAARIFGEEALDEAAEEFFCWPEEELMGEFDLEEHQMVFYPWFLFNWCINPDGDSELPGPRGISIAGSYLKERGRSLDHLEREYLQALADSPFSFYEVMETVPGKSLDLHNLILETDHHILEKTASGDLSPGDVVFASVITVGGIELFGGLSMFPFPGRSKIDIYGEREGINIGMGGELTREAPFEYDIELRQLYLHLHQAQTMPPAMQNTDGDDLAFNTLKYDIESPQEVFDSLKDLTGGYAVEEDLLEEADFDDLGKLERVEIPWIVKAKGKPGGMDNTLLGTIRIDGQKMSCEVNSRERAERLRGLVDERLKEDQARYLTTVIQSIESMMRNAPEGDSAGTGSEELMELPEIQEVLAQQMRKHWQSWVDMEIPALNDRSPREAVKDDLGCRQVLVLLEEAENNIRSGGMAGDSLDNIDWVRKELGLV